MGRRAFHFSLVSVAKTVARGISTLPLSSYSNNFLYPFVLEDG